MRLLAVVSKLTGVSTNVEASEITLSSPSIVKLSVSREEVSQLTRVNQDLVVTLRSGETITIKISTSEKAKRKTNLFWRTVMAHCGGFRILTEHSISSTRTISHR